MLEGNERNMCYMAYATLVRGLTCIFLKNNLLDIGLYENHNLQNPPCVGGGRAKPYLSHGLVLSMYSKNIK